MVEAGSNARERKPATVSHEFPGTFKIDRTQYTHTERRSVGLQLRVFLRFYEKFHSEEVDERSKPPALHGWRHQCDGF